MKGGEGGKEGEGKGEKGREGEGRWGRIEEGGMEGRGG